MAIDVIEIIGSGSSTQTPRHGVFEKITGLSERPTMRQLEVT